MKSDRPKVFLRCDACGHVVPPEYFIADLSDGPVRVCGPSCGDEITKTLRLAREAVQWKQVER
ncbi:MAG: hypothetical protein HC882_00865 [Acidobacteria bacterium]|nr:hypothetical protein [Acidobacteriota bacterium]